MFLEFSYSCTGRRIVAVCSPDVTPSCVFLADSGRYYPLSTSFRIQQIRTDRGHEFQAKLHWHVEDLGIRHVYIKARTPQFNGKVERSHRSDQQEFYQLLTYKDDVDLTEKLAEWEAFYNFARQHGAHHGKTPYESLREKLK